MENRPEAGGGRIFTLQKVARVKIDEGGVSLLGVNIRYFTQGVENIFYFDPVFRTDISLQRRFAANRLTASLAWNDVFRSDGMNTYTTLKDKRIQYTYYHDQSVVQLSLTYRFRSAENRYRSKSALGEEESRIKGL